MKKTIAFLIAAVFSCAMAAAQPGNEPAPGPEKPGMHPGGPCPMGQHSEMRQSQSQPEPDRQMRPGREMTQMLAIMRLIKTLDLTEEQSIKIYALYNQMAKNKREMITRTQEKAKAIREMLQKKKPNEKALKETLDAMDKESKENRARMDKLKEDMKNVLTVEQRAKFVVMVSQKIAHKPGKGTYGRPGNPGQIENPAPGPWQRQKPSGSPMNLNRPERPGQEIDIPEEQLDELFLDED